MKKLIFLMAFLLTIGVDLFAQSGTKVVYPLSGWNRQGRAQNSVYTPEFNGWDSMLRNGGLPVQIVGNVNAVDSNLYYALFDTSIDPWEPYLLQNLDMTRAVYDIYRLNNSSAYSFLTAKANFGQTINISSRVFLFGISDTVGQAIDLNDFVSYAGVTEGERLLTFNQAFRGWIELPDLTYTTVVNTAVSKTFVNCQKTSGCVLWYYAPNYQ